MEWNERIGEESWNFENRSSMAVEFYLLAVVKVGKLNVSSNDIVSGEHS